ncbi:hypothetical protein GCM10027416_10890 [Okibacterium endophyticum]
MSDARQRPQYGEYASPEEQQARIRMPVDHDEGVPAVAPGARETPAAQVPAQAPSGAADQSQSAARNGDRMATYVLLGVGLAVLLLSLPSMVQMPTALDLAFRQFGMGGYTSDGIATAMGWTALVVHVVCLVGAFVLARRFLAARKLAWWIPLVAGVIANVVFMVCLFVAMSADPAFTEYLNQVQP